MLSSVGCWMNWDDHSDVIYELYDYEVDPLETRNIALDDPEVMKDMKRILASHPEAKRR